MKLFNIIKTEISNTFKDMELSFDLETDSVYDNEDRQKFRQVLKERRALKSAEEKKVKKTFFGKIKYFFRVREQEPGAGAGYVFVMKDDNFIKIGFSIEPDQRVEAIERVVPNTKLVKAVWFENMREAKGLVHHHFRANRIFKHHGQTEWFDINTKDAIVKIQSLKPLINLVSRDLD